MFKSGNIPNLQPPLGAGLGYVSTFTRMRLFSLFVLLPLLAVLGQFQTLHAHQHAATHASLCIHDGTLLREKLTTLHIKHTQEENSQHRIEISLPVFENEEDDEPDSFKRYTSGFLNNHLQTGLFRTALSVDASSLNASRYILPASLHPYLLFKVFRI